MTSIDSANDARELTGKLQRETKPPFTFTKGTGTDAYLSPAVHNWNPGFDKHSAQKVWALRSTQTAQYLCVAGK